MWTLAMNRDSFKDIILWTIHLDPNGNHEVMLCVVMRYDCELDTIEHTLV